MTAYHAALRGLRLVNILVVVFVVALATTARAQWTTVQVTAPGVQYRTFQSATVGTNVSFHIYTPPVYNLQPLRRLPVLYWLHGAGSTTAGIAPMAGWFSNAMSLGLLPPMIVVFPNGMPYGMYCDSADGSEPIETVIINELIPHIDANFRTIATQSGRILEGFSMGGYGTGRLGIRHSSLFCGISMLAAAPLQLDFPNAPPDAPIPADRRDLIFADVWNSDPALVVATNPWTLAAIHAPMLAANGVLVRIAVGADDSVLEANIDFHNRLTSLGVTHTFNIYPGVGHQTIALLSAIGPTNWSFYRDALAPRCTATNIPVVALQPQPLAIYVGQTLNLACTPANGYANVSVQWQRNGVNITNGPGGASPGGGSVTGSSGPLASPTNGTPTTLTIANAQASDSGQYTTVFTNTCGSVTSTAATVTVTPEPLPCPADYNQDGGVDGADIEAFFIAWVAGDARADVNEDGGVDGSDVDAFFVVWGAGGC